jgi:hypothetical protein
MVNSIREAVALVRRVCHLPDNRSLIAETLANAAADGLIESVRSRDTGSLYGWLMDSFSFQGISDRIAADYIERNGNARWEQVQRAVDNHRCSCPKLAGFETYIGCGYRKAAVTCRNPTDLFDCPVPTLTLRKGDLNQLAFSLFFFLRDQCQGDLVGFIDATFAEIDARNPPDPIRAKREALINAFGQVHAISTKLIAMTFATLLMAGDPGRPDWIAVGQSMIAIDSLVHNFLHRTGILAVFGCDHAYGPACYGKRGCARVIYEIADRIDASKIDRDYPRVFPRLVQSAIWSFCAELHYDICNGRQIDDRLPCPQVDCPVGRLCSRVPLKQHEG